ncbi:MAG TPA: methanogenesis marker protein Mmp4/MtxX [Methanoregulaceae archaeon]|nr:methanogenesis marker protein Mmp4/MtxX [Methanoregulaceae archaeon]
MTTIGIGLGSDKDKVLESIRNAGISSEIVCYAYEPQSVPAGETFRMEVSDHPCLSMVSDLVSGRISAAVRGTLPANETLSALKSAAGVDSLERAALLETSRGKKFLLAPVGIDEGWTVSQKVDLIQKIQKIASRLGISEKVAVLSGGRFGDLGRHNAVDRSMADAELVARFTGAGHYQILIEEAIDECGVIIAPDGISGNLIFRTLTFLGSGHGHGAPVLNINYIFVDTSRASSDYANALRLAESLLK